MQSNPNKIKLINLTVIYSSELNKQQYGKGIAVRQYVLSLLFQQIPVSVLSPPWESCCTFCENQVFS